MDKQTESVGCARETSSLRLIDMVCLGRLTRRRPAFSACISSLQRETKPLDGNLQPLVQISRIDGQTDVVRLLFKGNLMPEIYPFGLSLRVDAAQARVQRLRLQPAFRHVRSRFHMSLSVPFTLA